MFLQVLPKEMVYINKKQHTYLVSTHTHAYIYVYIGHCNASL